MVVLSWWRVAVCEIGGENHKRNRRDMCEANPESKGQWRRRDIGHCFESEKGGKKSVLMRKSRRGDRGLAWTHE